MRATSWLKSRDVGAPLSRRHHRRLPASEGCKLAIVHLLRCSLDFGYGIQGHLLGRRTSAGEAALAAFKEDIWGRK
jgi:hypothetical protein